MDHLVVRIRRVQQFRDIPDHLLVTLLSHSERMPDRVTNGVILFQQGDIVTYWYLLLSGEVELYQTVKLLEDHYVDTLSAGCLFGEIDLPRHSCSARVKKTAEFVRISHQHFLATYNKYADTLQRFIVVMEDLINGRSQAKVPSSSKRSTEPYLEESYEFDRMRRALPSQPQPLPHQNGRVAEEDGYDWSMPANLFELSHSLSTETRIYEAALSLKRIMQLRAPTLIRDRLIHNVFYANSMIGSEMTKWLHELFGEIFNGSQTITNLQVVGIWQALLENNIIAHVTNEQPFKDKMLFYKWTIEDPYEDFYRRLSEHPNMQMMPSGGLVLPADQRDLPPDEAQPPTLLELQNALLFLCTIGPDSLFKIILYKPRYERTTEELEFVYEELKYVKALSHLSTSVKRELASVIRFECHQNAGTVLFHQGETGHSWYIILKGSVDVSIQAKGFPTSVRQTTLREQDDFGKLALVSDSTRPATIATVEDNCEFLVIDKDFFAKILRDVEANTVRLKEHGQDVLVLEKINFIPVQQPQTGSLVSRAKSQCCYSVMAGLPEKMIEYILETRMDADDGVDTFLEDFILTHIIYMPSNILCNYLKNYYNRRASAPHIDGQNHPVEMEFSLEKQLIAKRRVISFLSTWEMVLGINFFLDSVANSFVEEMYCCVIEDSKFIPNMLPIVEQITAVRQLRENAMRMLSRHSAIILDCGVYSIQAPAPEPILPFLDTCNQCVYLSDTTYITISVRLDKTSSDIAELARSKLRCSNTNEECFLIEVKSSGERVVYAPTEVGVPTMLSLNGKLYVVFKDEIDSLIPLPEQNGPTEPVYHSVMDLMAADDIAHQLYLFHMELFEATDELELIFQVIGRDQFLGRVPANLDILLRRFNEVQYWTTTEVLLAATPVKRLNILKKLIKIAVHAKGNKDLLTLFAIVLGLSNISVSRLTQLWQRLPGRFRRVYAEFEALLDPSRNHRAYRIFVSKMSPPLIPFIPLLLKDLTFIHEGNKTYFAGLVNFEKMHMIANLLRNFRNCKSKFIAPNVQPKNPREIQSIVRNFRIIDNQRRLMEISYQIQPPNNPPHR